MRTKITVAVMLVVVLTGCVNLYKIEPIAFQHVDMPEDLVELNDWIADNEAKVSGIKLDNEKEIIWVDPENPSKTPLSIIYIHGFTASRGEVWPVFDIVASNLGANLYYTRLTGHGLSNGCDLIAEATLSDWMTDVCEAYTIGRQIGDRVIIAGTSFGGLLATYLAANTNEENTHALVLMAPCFQLKEKWKQNIVKFVTRLPWDTYLIQGSFGKYLEEHEISDMIKQYYTSNPRSDAALDVIDMMDKMEKIDLSAITVPVLLFYSIQDERTCPNTMLARFSEMKSVTNRIHHVTDTTDARGHHVPTGYLWASTNNTERVAGQTIDFIRDLSNRTGQVTEMADGFEWSLK